VTDQSPEQRELTDGTGSVLLFRNVKFKHGAKELGTGDRMLLKYRTGEQEDVVVIREGGSPKVKRAMSQLEIQAGTAATNAMSSGGYTLEDVDTADEKRLMAAYSMFSSGK
jgi:hypothetical protein